MDFLNLEGEADRESGWRVFLRQKPSGEHYESYQREHTQIFSEIPADKAVQVSHPNGLI